MLEIDKSPMIIRTVLHNGKLVGLYSCGTDAAEMAKRYPGASIVLCRLNSETAASMGIDAVATTHRSGVVDCNDCVQARCTTAFYEMLSPLGNDCAKAPVVGQLPMSANPFATTWRGQSHAAKALARLSHTWFADCLHR